MALIQQESGFNQNAISKVGAQGLMQLMPVTYKEINVGSDIFNVDNNIKAGSIYYERLRKSLGNKDLYAISAYNGGIGSVNSWMSKIIYNDTDDEIDTAVKISEEKLLPLIHHAGISKEALSSDDVIVEPWKEYIDWFQQALKEEQQ